LLLDAVVRVALFAHGGQLLKAAPQPRAPEPRVVSIQDAKVGQGLLKHPRLQAVLQRRQEFEDLLEFQPGIRNAGKAHDAQPGPQLEVGASPLGQGGAPALRDEAAPAHRHHAGFGALQALQPPAQHGDVLHPGGLPGVARRHGVSQGLVHLFKLLRTFVQRLHAARHDLGERAQLRQIAAGDLLSSLRTRAIGQPPVGPASLGLRRAGFSFDQIHVMPPWKMEIGNWKLENRNWKLENRNWKFETRNSKIENRARLGRCRLAPQNWPAFCFLRISNFDFRSSSFEWRP
jgi:hypothetical protein